MANPAHTNKAEVESWCPRCQEREVAPNPKVPLEDPLREKFCLNVAIQGMKGGKAYMAAGYATRNASRASHAGSALRKRIEIANRIEALLERQAEYALESREWVDAQLKEVVNRCMQKVPVVDRHGKPTGVWKFDGKNANQALHLMGKDRGMFVDKVEVVNPDQATEGKTDEEVMRMAMGLMHDLGRPFFLKAAEEVFGLKLTDGGQEADGGKTPMVGPVRTLQ